MTTLFKRALRHSTVIGTNLNSLSTSSRSYSVLKDKIGVLFGLGAGIGVGCTLAWGHHHHVRKKQSPIVLIQSAPVYAKSPEGDTGPEAGRVKEGLPSFSLEEVSKHNTAESRVWVTSGDGVYDITDFVDLHPGGSDKLMLAAGKALEPFWEVYAAHKTREVYSSLEEWRIGNLAPNDRGKNKHTEEISLFNDEPVRSPKLEAIRNQPFSAGTPLSLLANSFLTPNDIFFTRNHFPVPRIDPQEFFLEINVEGIETVRLTLDDLRSKFTEYTVTAAVQCAGNRRNDLAKVKPLNPVGLGAYIGNAEWTGVRLRDVLLYAGLQEAEEYDPIQHVHLEGLDNDPLTGERYGASIPVHKAMNMRGDTILAYRMNGEELPRDHGYPLRAVVPGTVGARSVKWLSRIVASKEEHSGLWQQQYYKGFSPAADWNDLNVSTAPAIQDMPVQSMICTPEDGSSLNADTATLTGIAWSGGGRGIIRVDVSSDGGKTWQTADLLEGSDQPSRRAWAWTRWSATVQLPSKGEVELCCKAVDTSYNVQPDTSAPIWNLRGYLSTAWHRIVINIR